MAHPVPSDLRQDSWLADFQYLRAARRLLSPPSIMESFRTAMPLDRLKCLVLCAARLLGCSANDPSARGNEGHDAELPEGGVITVHLDAARDTDGGAIVVHGDGAAAGDAECRRDVSLTAVTLGE